MDAMQFQPVLRDNLKRIINVTLKQFPVIIIELVEVLTNLTFDHLLSNCE